MLRQQLLVDCEIKIRDFHRFVLRIQQENHFLLSQIGNTYQTALKIDTPQSSTVELKHAERLHMKTTGARKTMVHSDFGSNS